MYNHFDKYLNLKKIIEDTRPGHIVECGALFGENTKRLISLKASVPFKLTVITDNKLLIDGVDEMIRGLSYEEISKMPDDSIDICIIDTDHNYWTLAKELSALHLKLKKDGLIVLHDVEAFYFDTGILDMYFNGRNYPKEEIELFAKTYGGMGMALIDFLCANKKNYQLITFTSESCGAAVIKKVMREITFFARPTEERIEQIVTQTEGEKVECLS